MCLPGFPGVPGLTLTLSQGHGVRSHVPDQHHVHAVVLAAHLLQRDVPGRQGTVRGPRRGPRDTSGPSHACFLQGWVYNMVPWLCAIPLAVGGGYVSDVLINKGQTRRALAPTPALPAR